MGKDKHKRWSELLGYKHVIQPSVNELLQTDFSLKGHWNDIIFKNDHPIVLELGCGKGEYTVGLARKYAGKNFIGVDIKGARMWKGARIVDQENLHNAAFLRTRIELIQFVFNKNEIDEIWITFPDPQPKQKNTKKRLTCARFLNLYQTFLKPTAVLHLKTDNRELFTYTKQLLIQNQASLLFETENLYDVQDQSDINEIQTFYEKKFLLKGSKIYYLRFTLPVNKKIAELKKY